MEEKEIEDDPRSSGRPRGETLNNLGAIRRKLAKLVRDFEQIKAVDKISIDRLRALVYAYGTLSSITKDAELDEIMERVEALETKNKEQTK
jgi:hypothetical protein